ncbi:hypothetical protein JAAARDRAFT_616030 [Jaapia argillacea MUCL 33604]|uniref:Secreted protein n=1 Tax=Jaapia argillacea MUCL 33604 TaxID=933084 RepID=A0A067P4D5_9AGAM|nr:hypothetical protein JAAARDRAFT_616030 [Jaapia argillacea MUCL 33604]
MLMLVLTCIALRPLCDGILTELWVLWVPEYRQIKGDTADPCIFIFEDIFTLLFKSYFTVKSSAPSGLFIQLPSALPPY